jgi:hypothetical protein
MFSISGEVNRSAFSVSPSSDNETSHSTSLESALDPIFSGLDADFNFPYSAEPFRLSISSESIPQRETAPHGGVSDPSVLRDVPFHVLMAEYVFESLFL